MADIRETADRRRIGLREERGASRSSQSGRCATTVARGFTLVELLIVIAVIAILASIAVPSFLRGQSAANESAVIATLRSVAQAAIQFRSQAVLDEDYDGVSEFGTLAEMSGVKDIRGTSAPLSPPLLSPSLGQVDTQGRVTRYRYHFALYLPDAAGRGVGENAAGLATVDPAMARDYFTCLAWPMRNGTSGAHTYFVNQQGQVSFARTDYEGTTNIPPPGAALLGVPPDQINSQWTASNTVGADGNTWFVVPP